MIRFLPTACRRRLSDGGRGDAPLFERTAQGVPGGGARGSTDYPGEMAAEV